MVLGGVGIVLGVIGLTALVVLPVRFVLGLDPPAADDDRFAASVLTQMLTLAIAFVISTALLAAMLPTSFARACLVTLFEYLIVLGVAAVLGGALFVVFGVA